MGDYQLVLLLLGGRRIIKKSLQSSLTEFQRTLYLLAVHGKRDIVDSNPLRVKEAAEREGTFFARLLHTLHIQYYRQQRAVLASTAKVEDAVIEWLEKNPDRAGEMAGLYEKTQRSSLKAWALLAPNSHKIGIILSAFVPVAAGSFWISLGMGWYILYDLSLNLVMVWLVRRQAGINERTLAEIRRLDGKSSAPLYSVSGSV
jgi:hypothetical protein